METTSLHLKWKPHPSIYEINTWPWLEFLSNQYQREITLANIPEEVFQKQFQYFDVIWLMGVWKRSPESQIIASTHESLLKEYKTVLDDFQKNDVIGSPYAINKYEIESRLGGIEGYNIFRDKLHQKGKKIILDFVPNHLAVDNPWVVKHPEFFIQGKEHNLHTNPKNFFQKDHHIFAHGKDPYFEAWTDTVQFNAFSRKLRDEIIILLLKIASMADGIRCDMAMLVETNVFYKTWSDLLSAKPNIQYWEYIIPKIKEKYPEFKFIAEVYWDMEWALQQQGFDFCYDKRLYDRILHERDEVQSHLKATWEYQSKLLRFLENHDEPRLSAKIPRGEQKSLLGLITTLPGAHLIHFGQMQGFTKKLPVQLKRYPSSHTNYQLSPYYEQIFHFLGHNFGKKGKWTLLQGVSITPKHLERYLILYLWEYIDEKIVICNNLSDKRISFKIKFNNTKIVNESEAFILHEILDPENKNFPPNMKQLTEKVMYLTPYNSQFIRYIKKQKGKDPIKRI